MLFTGCAKDRVPGYVLSKKEFTSLIVDIHIAEATYSQKRGNYRRMDPQALVYYKSVLDKHGITKELMDTTIYWYSNHPNVYLEVYDKAIGELSEMEAQAESDLSKVIEEKKKKSAEIIDLWEGARSYDINPNDTIGEFVPFMLKTDSILGGRISFSINYTFKKEDISTKNELWLMAFYTDSVMDTTKVAIKKSFTRKRTILNYNLNDTLYLLSLKGFLLKHDSLIKPYVTIDQIRLQHIPLVEREPFKK